jgi:hypothetical protein
VGSYLALDQLCMSDPRARAQAQAQALTAYAERGGVAKCGFGEGHCLTAGCGGFGTAGPRAGGCGRGAGVARRERKNPGLSCGEKAICFRSQSGI